MDLNCFNGVRSGKAEERKRKHLEALALESNAGMEGNRSMQALWLVNRHSFSMQGSPGRRPLSMSGPNVSVDRLGRPDYSKRPSETDKSFKSTTDESGRIMDAWKPAVYGNVATLPPGEMGIKRQSWGGTTPTIRVTDEAVDARHHNRARSSSAMEELMSHSSLPSRANSASPGYDLFAYTPTAVGSSAAGSSVGGHHSQGQGQNPGLSPHGLQPPPLILRCDSAMSDDTDDAPPPRQRTTSGGWFRRAPPAISDDSDTENEGAAPSRRGWRAMFKRGHPVMDDQERGEKMARSAAALNASGAAFAGVSGTGFRVHRKTRTASSDALAAVQGSDMPLLAPPAASFRVRRPGCDSASLTPPESLPPSPVPDSPIVLSETSTVHVGPSRSTSTDVPHSPAGSAFRVVRKVSPAGSNVSTPQLVAPPAVPKPQHAEPAIDFTLGYDSDAFRPLDIDFGASPVGSNGSHSRYGHAL